jgi:hypothetical protein
MTFFIDQRLDEKTLSSFHASDFPGAVSQFCQNCSFGDGCLKVQNPGACLSCFTNAIAAHFVLDESELTELMMAKLFLWSDVVDRAQVLEETVIVA